MKPVGFRPSRFPVGRIVSVLAVGVVSMLCSFASAGAAAVERLAPWRSVAEQDRAAGRDDLYRRGQLALDEARWADAAELFAQLEAKKGPDTDAALYWRAYALAKASRRAEAQEVLGRLTEGHPESAWLNDARALALEIRLAGSGDARATEGRDRAARSLDREVERLDRELERIDRARERTDAADRREAEAELSEDEELKLFALNSLMAAEPERAVDTLEKFLLQKHARKLDEQALFVLGQADSPRAADLLAKIAAGTLRPELRWKAIEMLGVAGDERSLDRLDQLLRTASDPAVRIAVVQGYFLSNEAGSRVVALAKSEKDPLVRAKAIEVLGLMQETAPLVDLYRAETSPALRAQILDAFGISGEVEFLAEVAKSEKDPALVSKAISNIGVFGGDSAGRLLTDLYQANADGELREQILDAFGLSGEIEFLAQVARTERDPELVSKAISVIGVFGGAEGGPLLSDLYRANPDREVRRRILEAFLVNGDAKTLISIAKEEKDRALRRKALEVLSLMGDDEAQDYLLDMLER